MNLQNLRKLAQLKAVLIDMEQDFGVSNLTEQEIRILSAMTETLGPDVSLVSSKTIRNSLYCKSLSSPTYHRALKALLSKQILKPAQGRKTGLYALCLD
ncbi:MAG: hypothetical protein HOL98_10645 [Gammaproteobacteria bacterium]|nr:hypothetical protein [Gammaproteobacteria bacterium]